MKSISTPPGAFARIPDAKSIPFLAAALLALLPGCLSMGPDFKPPEWDGPAAWKTAVTNAPAVSPLPGGAPWWSVFNDPVLNALESELMEQNPTLAAAVARLDAAAAQLGMARAARVPSVDAGASAAYDRQTGETHGSSRLPDNPAWLYKPGASFSWELDFWGRVRRNIEAARADFNASAQDVRDARRLLSAELASSYLSLRTTQARLEYARQNAKLQADTLEFIRNRHKNGLCGDLDLRQAEMNLASTRAGIPSLEADVDSALNTICTLLGLYPGSKDDLRKVAAIPVPEESALPAALPADLLRNRPDVAAAIEKLHAAVARIGAAKAELFPKVSLGGSFYFAATDGGRLFTRNAQNYSFGPSVEWPVFDAGKRLDNIRYYEASARAAEADFRQAVLSAAAECETALSARRAAFAALNDLRDAVTAAEKAVKLSDSMYRDGLTDFQNVLDMQRQLATNRDSLAQGLGSAATALADVWKSFAGPVAAETEQPEPQGGD